MYGTGMQKKLRAKYEVCKYKQHYDPDLSGINSIRD